MTVRLQSVSYLANICNGRRTAAEVQCKNLAENQGTGPLGCAPAEKVMVVVLSRSTCSCGLMAE